MDFIIKVCLSHGNTTAGKNMKTILKGGNKKVAKFTFQDLVRDIVEAVQTEIAKISDFDNGAIRLLFVPKCDKAVGFFGGFGRHCEIDLGFPVREGASHTRAAKWRGKEDRKECDCYGYAALKIEGCAYALRNNLGRRSCDMPEEAETWGRASDQGCVVYDIFITDRFGIGDNSSPEHYFRLYVSVSGAMGDEDERCALAASSILQTWCDTELDYDGFGHFEKYLSLLKPE
jgi:hypothetical protein